MEKDKSKNKQVISFVVLGLLIIGGFFFFTKKEQANNTIQNIPVNSASSVSKVTVAKSNTLDCTGVVGKKIEVIFPNGGEVLKLSDPINIKWQTCNTSK